MIYGYVPDYVLFDLETTGTSCIYDEVIEISAVKVRSGKVVEEFSQLVNPKRPIPYAASMVNHISDEMVANEPDFGQVLPEFLTFAGDDILVGHNIPVSYTHLDVYKRQHSDRFKLAYDNVQLLLK